MRSHHEKDLSHLLPVYDKVDMHFGSYTWSPFVLCTLNAGIVAMEVTAGSFDVLFNIVQAQMKVVYKPKKLRRLTLIKESSRAKTTPKVRAGKKKVTAKQVLDEDEAESCISRKRSSSEDS